MYNNIYKNNKYLIISRGGLGDLIYLMVIIENINFKYDNTFIYDILVYNEYSSFCSSFFNNSKIYSIKNKNFNIFWGYHTHSLVKKINNNIIFFLSKCSEIDNKIILNNFPEKYKIDNINLDYYKFSNKINIDIKNDKKNIGLALTSTNGIKNMNPDICRYIIDFLLNENYRVYNFGPNIDCRNDFFVNVFDSLDFYYMLNLVSKLDFCITIDTSLMHMASVNRIPFCAFFNITDPEKIIEYIKVSSWNNYEYYKVECFEQSFVLNKVISFLKNHEF